MAFACNINRQGRTLRIVLGALLLIAGIVLVFTWALPSPSLWAWGVVVACIAGGAFAIFEGTIGWCAARAMGFKTSI